MKDQLAIQTFLTELGIGNYATGIEIELCKADVENLGGPTEVFDAITDTFGKGFSIRPCDNEKYVLTSIY